MDGMDLAMRLRTLTACAAVLALGVVGYGTGATAPAIAASAAPGSAVHGSTVYSATARRSIVRAGICTAPGAYREVAAHLSADVQAALRGRAGAHAVGVADIVTGVSCYSEADRHFVSASIVKAIILAALLRWHQETHQRLSPWERHEATLMITQSDNAAADELWEELGPGRLLRFLRLAHMRQTRLGPGLYWGLTEVTAHDEVVLLRLLTTANPVLSAGSRAYQLGLMSRVTPAQRWGTPAGAPRDVAVHVKNGWLPDDTGWHINSIGAFTGRGKNYLITVLTADNFTQWYGIDTIEAVARVVHRDLNAADSVAPARLAANVAPSPTAPAPPGRAVVPALPTPAPGH